MFRYEYAEYWLRNLCGVGMCSFMVNLLLSKFFLMLTFMVHLTVKMFQPYYTDFSIILWNMYGA